jgi:hypothetical protein
MYAEKTHKNMHEICMKYALNMEKICKKYEEYDINMQEICDRYAKNMHENM